ncbi:MAG: LiaI-LiaF-like domain-containing protein [Bryobacteraceae bacterium]
MKTRAVLFAQAVRSPILVVTIGVLFAIQQAGILPFSRTWPLIIIMIGLMKLIERLLAPHPPYAQPGAPPQ